MTRPEPVFIGYFPKRTTGHTHWINNPVVEEVCSVSECLSEGPPNWIDKWKHNDRWVYDTEEMAWSVIDDDRKAYDMYAYKMFPIVFDGAKEEPWAIGSTARGDLSGYQFLGFDIVNRTCDSTFECSPLSCNGGFNQYPVNRHCLIDDLEDAWRICREIATEAEEQGSWEPGPYYLVAVHRKKKKAPVSPADGA
ncbi:MAG: hypothetical protein QUV05_08585 [Phycisphaerae bacterium]|nr:hypothetical protein [Phycisphaerae bacterium]